MNELKKTPYQDNEQSINTIEKTALYEGKEAAQTPGTKEELLEIYKQIINFARNPLKEKTTKDSELSKTSLKEVIDEMSKVTACTVGLVSLISYLEEHKEELNLDENRLNDLYDSFDLSFDDLIVAIKSDIFEEKTNFCEQLKEARTAKGLTQRALSRQTKIPLRTIEAWETEERIPPEYVQRFLLNELKKDTE